MKYKFIKPDTFIGKYMQSMQAVETPASYDFWCACWLMSQALGRRTIVQRPSAPVFLNWYVILVAESGITRKSTAVRNAAHIARQCFELWGEEHLATAKSTPEQLEAVMHVKTEKYGHAHLSIAISELVTFLGREKAVIQMPGVLTDLYDCPAQRSGGGSISRGNVVIRNNFTTLLAASTPVWLVRSIHPDVVEGGFTSRTMFVMDDTRKKKIAWGEQEMLPSELFVEMLTEMRSLSHERKTIGITAPALARFKRWYNTRTESTDVFRSSFESREDAHVLRLAAMLSVNDGTWMIGDSHINNAIQVIIETKERGAQIFEGRMDSSDLSIAIDKLRGMLIDAGRSGLKQGMLSKAVDKLVDAKAVRAVLATMHELGMVDRFADVKLGGRGAPTTLWRATNLIMKPDAIDVVKGAMPR